MESRGIFVEIHWSRETLELAAVAWFKILDNWDPLEHAHIGFG